MTRQIRTDKEIANNRRALIREAKKLISLHFSQPQTDGPGKGYHRVYWIRRGSSWASDGSWHEYKLYWEDQTHGYATTTRTGSGYYCATTTAQLTDDEAEQLHEIFQQISESYEV